MKRRDSSLDASLAILYAVLFAGVALTCVVGVIAVMGRWALVFVLAWLGWELGRERLWW